jgi:4-amino-4-deoxy-L-arabinose transferase-like glycosyltransferase
MFQYAKHAAAFSSALVSRSTLTRFLTPVDSNTGGPLFFLLGWLRLAPVAFVLFAAPVVYFLYFDRKKTAAASPFIFLTLLFFVAISLSASKRDLYLVLLHPSAAIAAGVLLVEFQQSLKTRRLQSVAPVLLVVLALAGFVPFYVGKPDYAHHLKETGRKLKKAAKAGDSIAAVEIPLNNLLFYSRKPVEYIRYSSLKERYPILLRDRHRTTFFVVKTKEVKRFSTLVDSFGGGSLRKKIVHKNRRFTIVAIQSGGKI